MAKRRRESFNPRVDPSDEKFHPIAKNMSVGIWKGWKASLIVSKQKGLPVVAWDGPIEEAQAEERKKKIEPSSVESSLTGTVCPLKRFSRKKERTEKALPVIARDGSIEEARAEERKRKIEPSSVKLSLMGKVGPLKSCSTKRKRINDSALAHPAALLFDEMGVEDMKLLKEGVDALSMHVMLNVSCLRLLHDLLGDDSYRRFMESVFRSVANFVLSVFDKEDFERMHHDDEICGEWQTVCSMLTDKIGTSTKEEVVGKAVDTVIKESHRFPSLTDHDFCQILGGYAEGIGQFKILAPVHYVSYPFRFDFLPITVKNDGIIRPSQWLQKDDIHKSFRDNVIEEAIQNFVPLKEYCKTQLGLELLCTNGYRVYDALVIEVLKDIKIDRLFEITHKAPKEYEDFDFSNPRAVVSHVLIDIVQGLYTLGYFKTIALKFSENALASCVSNTFGPCKAEVIEVIKMADCERRLNNKRSISLENIRYGLSLSRVGEFVKENIRYGLNLIGEIPKSFWNNVAEEAVQNFVPLKEYCKAQLGLELLCTNGYHVYDTLVIEVLKDIKIDRLLEIAHKAPKEHGPFDPPGPRQVVSHVLIDIVRGLYRLGWFKSQALKYSQNGLANCLTYTFGPCKAEVIEVIKMADHDRRLNNKRSISLENIRYGLSLSRVGEFVKEIPVGSPPKFSIVEFFKLSCQKAIDMDDEKVGIQHLVLAMNTVLSKDLMENASLVHGADKVVARHLKSLKKRNINKQQSVRSWKEYSPMYRILKSKFRILGGGTVLSWRSS